MSYFWVCSECGSANDYPEDKVCAVCNKIIDEAEKNRTTGIIQVDRYDDKKDKLFRKCEDDNVSVLHKYDNNIHVKTVHLSNIYKIIDGKIGVDGSRAFDITDNRYVLLRCFGVDERDEIIKRRIRNRFKILAPLQHQAISKTYEVYMEPTQVWIAEEFIDYVSLEDLIQTLGIVKYEDAIIISIQILEVLMVLHKNGCTHGNLNPKNIKITSNNNVFITGLLYPFTKSQLTNYENYCVSPEQIKFENDAPSSDIYSVGALLYKMINGRYPNRNRTGTLAFCKIARCSINKDLPTGLEQIVLHSLEICAEDRYETVEEMLGDLKSLYKDRTKIFSFNSNNRTKKVETKESEKKKSILNKLLRK